jgi:hypothetical protein
MGGSKKMAERESEKVVRRKLKGGRGREKGGNGNGEGERQEGRASKFFKKTKHRFEL